MSASPTPIELEKRTGKSLGFAGDVFPRALEASLQTLEASAGAPAESGLFQELGALVRERDVTGLRDAFSRATLWDTRETVIVAFTQLLREHPDLSASGEVRSALEDILELCRAEPGGGSYRDNCINSAERMLGEMDGGVG